MVSSLLTGNMNMAEWERQAHYQGVNESRSSEGEGSEEEDAQQWHSGYLPSSRQPQYPQPYGFPSYNTSVPEPVADSAIPFPLYQAQAFAPYSPMSHELPSREMDLHPKHIDEDDDRKPAAVLLGATSQIGRDSSFESDGEAPTDWAHYEQQRQPAAPTYAPPRRNFAQLPPSRRPLPQPYPRQQASISHSRATHRHPSPEEREEAQTPRAKQALQSWYDRFNELIEYKAIHGDCNVPQKYEENQKLGVWVNKQRMEKKFLDDGKRSSMTEIKKQNLESIGFKWAKRKGNVSWDIKYNELKQYKVRHGNCNVPTKYTQNPSLGRWVSTQRSEYKKFQQGRSKHMDEEKVQKLDRIGFRWEMLQQRSDSDESPDRP